jgi:phage gp36-like protein
MYATQDDLVQRFGIEELHRHAWDAEADAPDAARIERALQDATATCDLYIGATNRLPVSPVPPMLARIAADIARYILQDDAPLDEAVERHKHAISVLRDIAAGRATLTPGATEPALDAWVSRGDADRLFTRETLDQF